MINVLNSKTQCLKKADLKKKNSKIQYWVCKIFIVFYSTDSRLRQIYFIIFQSQYQPEVKWTVINGFLFQF